MNWNNYVMKKYGGSIREEIFRAYERSFAKATIISKIQDVMLQKLMDDIPEKKWVEAG